MSDSDPTDPAGNGRRVSRVTDSDPMSTGDRIGAGRGGTPGGSDTFPAFQLPPPMPSDRTTLDHARIRALCGGDNATLWTVANHLDRALRGLRSERRYYATRGGVVVATRLERILDDGRPAPGDNRFRPPEQFSLSETMASILAAPPGRFRLVLFLIGGDSMTPSAQGMTRGAAERLMGGGRTNVPGYLRKMAFGEEEQVEALIYEFARGRNAREVNLVVPGQLSAEIHLERSGLARAILLQPR
jgi:hypothetical protein